MKYAGLCHECKARIQLEAVPTETQFPVESSRIEEPVCIDRGPVFEPQYGTNYTSGSLPKIEVRCPVCQKMTEIAYVTE